MNYPLFVKSKTTGNVFVRGFVHPQKIYAQYWRFDKLHLYVNPVTLEFQPAKLSFECIRQLAYLYTFNTLKTVRSLYEDCKDYKRRMSLAIVGAFIKCRTVIYSFLYMLLVSILSGIWWLMPSWMKRYRKNIWCGRNQQVYFCISYIKDFRANALYLVIFGYEFWFGEQRPTFLNRKQNND